MLEADFRYGFDSPKMSRERDLDLQLESHSCAVLCMFKSHLYEHFQFQFFYEPAIFLIPCHYQEMSHDDSGQPLGFRHSLSPNARGKTIKLC